MFVRPRARRLVVSATLAALAVAGVHASSTQAQTKPAVSLAIPAYFTDDATWDRVVNAPAVAYVIGHPDTPAAGAKFVAEKGLTDHLAQAKSKGKTTLVYVTAGYDKISWETVADRIDSAFDAYPNADGVFIDEINYDQCDKYKNLSAGSGSVKGVRARHPGKLVVLNPGAPILNCYQGLADGYLNLERADKDIAAWVTNVNLPGNTPYYAWMFKPEVRGQMWEMIHSVPEGKLEQAIDEAVARNASVLYITPDVLPNPYDSIPDAAAWTRILDRVNSYASGKTALPSVKQLVVPAGSSTAASGSSASASSSGNGVSVKVTVSGTKKTVKKKIVKKKSTKKP